jgi:hypothetical protein
MSYRLLVKSQVNKAFKDIGDLAKTVTLVQKKMDSFDFSTSEVVEGTKQSTTVTAIVTVSKNKESSTGNANEGLRNVIRRTLLMKSEDITMTTLTSYSTVLIDAVEWTIVPPFKDNEFTITIDVIREV